LPVGHGDAYTGPFMIWATVRGGGRSGDRFGGGGTGVAAKPRLLVIDRDTLPELETWRRLGDAFEVVHVRTMARALATLRQEHFAGVYVDSAQLSAVRWAGVLIQADEILEAIADGVVVVDPEIRIIWANPEFLSLTGSSAPDVGVNIFQALGSPEVMGPDPAPFTTALATKQPASTVVRMEGNCYLKLTITPVFDAEGLPSQLIVLTRDVTAEIQQQQKIDAIHKAGEELADLTPEELAQMGEEDRTALLKYNIVRHMKDLLGLDFIEIRLLEPEHGRLIPLLTEGMTPLAAHRELYARKQGNGVTGFVAATGQSYLCPDTTNDPLYIEGAAGARSSLTVPLLYHGTIIGTLNVENDQPDAFDERDRQFLEIYARNVAAALNTLELLDAEKRHVASASIEAFRRELALPLDDILSSATTVLDRYSGHDEEIVHRLKLLLGRAREIRSLIPKVGSTLAPEDPAQGDRVPPRLANARVLVVDAEESVRRSAHQLLGREGATVETAQNAREAIALARQSPYSVALADIRLPDMEGYEIYRRLRQTQPGLPVILMTGFGYDPSHAIVKARQDGLQTVLYKPFRADRLMEAVEQALRTSDQPPRTGGAGTA
jgi:CheY-like chemotaxis protein